MSHLTDDRLFELGVDPDAPASAAERAHLEACPTCAARLAAERELTLALTADAWRIEPPADFVARTSARFQAARAELAVAPTAAAAKRSLRPLSWALAASAAFAVAAVGLLAANLGEIVPHLVILAKDVMVVVAALALAASKVPLGPLFVAASAATVLLAWSMAMSRLVNLSDREINQPAAA
ncbi:MAG: hypothetical protein IPK07_25365 [Deltaproteobacteria bacterium]|jgi:hypothetical protein|nr:hypothetical protein [Deltaproteobacteria bacterium]